ncbi:hypothetical protein I8751_02010 [Nostocaceae cyanobacterium CENA357]|uniref:Uncharacterized protein n=1 Tax=Atlanticothrix silvestris CENA357 TaxID=1725252 RepID=A0A8J7HDF7_9CYAN|nr:hypothetical protein [Atlanticothrix silvestris]MBH8551175.1 hypothetical protein [Atlanticothrix silvestris CENA357]
MKGFKKLSSIVLLLLAFTYPPALAQAKDSSLNNVPNESETNLVEGTNGELLLTQRRNRRHHYRHRRGRNRQHYRRGTRRNYYRRGRNRQHYYRRRYRSINYSGQRYRHGQWELVRDRHGRLMYNWQRF